jgi:hypothetical protein
MIQDMKILFGSVVLAATSVASGQASVAILRNFANQEIDRMAMLLDEMGLDVTIFDQGQLTEDNAPTFDLVIWNDLSFANNGLQDPDVLAMNAAYMAGVPIYLIGDDLAISYDNLDPAQDVIWESLLHLAQGVNIVQNDEMVEIVRPAHPITDGPFGVVGDFQCGIDPDGAVASRAGEIVLGIVDKWDAILAYPESGDETRTVTQNVLLMSGHVIDQPVRDALFKNSVSWLLGGLACPADCDANGSLNILDFVCFQQQWQRQTPVGDCDDNGAWNILDFVCYQGLFTQGCP